MKFSLFNIWNAKGVGKDSFKFRLVAYFTAIFLIIVHHAELGLPFDFLEGGVILSLLVMPHIFLHRYIKSGYKLSRVILDSQYDFFFAGLFIGTINVSIIPSLIFAMGATTNYLAMRGYRKLYRILLIPVGMIPPLLINGFEFRFETTSLMLYLSLGYSVIHYLINSYILYYSGIMVRRQNTEIEFQRREIEEKSEELRQLNESLNLANAELENKVKSRTRELEIKNKKLEEYTFMNAHKLRAPIATVLGLIHLLDLEMVNGNDEVLSGLKKTANELDLAIRGIREKLEEEDLDF